MQLIQFVGKYFLIGAKEVAGMLAVLVLMFFIGAFFVIPILAYLYWNVWFAIPIELFLVFAIGWWFKLLDHMADKSM